MRDLLILMLIVFPLIVFSQISATTDNGKKVILHENGTWEYEKEKTKVKIKNHECNTIIETLEDKMTGQISQIMSKPITITNSNSEGILISLIKAKGVIAFSTSVVSDMPCIEKGGKIYLLFEDGSRFTLLNILDFNCDGNSMAAFSITTNNEDALEKFKNKKLDSVRVVFSKGSADFKLGKKQAEKLKNGFLCLE